MWSHRLRVVLDYNPREIDWAKEHCTLERIARLWKSYLADSRYAMDETLSPSMGGDIRAHHKTNRIR